MPPAEDLGQATVQGPGARLEQQIGALGRPLQRLLLAKSVLSTELTSDSTKAVEIAWPACRRAA